MTSQLLPRPDAAAVADLHQLLRSGYPAADLIITHWDAQPWTVLFSDAGDLPVGFERVLLAPYSPVRVPFVPRQDFQDALDLRVVPRFVAEHLQWHLHDLDGFCERLSRNRPAWEHYPTTEQVLDTLARAWGGDDFGLLERADPRVLDAVTTIVAGGGLAALMRLLDDDLDAIALESQERYWPRVLEHLDATATAYRAASA